MHNLRCIRVKFEYLCQLNGFSFADIRRSLLSTYSGPSNGAPPEGGIDRSAILTASLPYVKEHGWSIAAVSYGARSLELPGVVHGLFPRGGVELVDHFDSLCNQQLVEFLQQSTSGELPLALHTITISSASISFSCTQA